MPVDTFAMAERAMCKVDVRREARELGQLAEKYLNGDDNADDAFREQLNRIKKDSPDAYLKVLKKMESNSPDWWNPFDDEDLKVRVFYGENGNPLRLQITHWDGWWREKNGFHTAPLWIDMEEYERKAQQGNVYMRKFLDQIFESLKKQQ